jgi:transcriptional regulator with AAA-type ATPase domain
MDPRAGYVVAEIERLAARGRHAAAERALRAAMAACDRRGDAGRSGDLAVRLGRLLLARGRAEEARVVFSSAHERFQQLRVPERAIEAMALTGVAQTDLARLSDAEQSCRAAYSAAVALGNTEAALCPGLALVRVLFWQKRCADARSLLEAMTACGDGGLCARYWCLAARLQVAAGAIGEAWKAVERARPAVANLDAATESIVRECEASIQAGLGDVEALRCHVEHGLTAARAAHLPLQAIKLRLTHVEGLSRAGRQGRARAAARHLGDIRAAVVPPLLKARIDSVLAGLARPSAAHESQVCFQPVSLTGDLQDLDGLRDLLAGSHRLEDEADALSRAAAAIRRHVQAAGVGIFGWHHSTARLCASSGTSSSAMAQRSIDIGQPIRPERSGSCIESAVPIQYLGRVIGAMAMRWSIEGPDSSERALAFGAAACAVCAPLVYVLIERESMPACQDAPFDLVGVSPAIEDVRKAIARAANAPFTVLLEGESGSGKELVARAIHRAGCRRDRRFCALNCAAMPEDLVDAELFGHAKGAFTGAAMERLGLFESADGGTVFLDEVGELSSRAQAKVLRVLQEGEIRRIGENFTRSFDARLIAATNRSLRAEVDAGRFRQDLLYRLDVIRVNVPPLRERVEDIPLLAARFWRQSAERMGSKAVLARSAVSALARYDWPGNVRELQNVLMALVVSVPLRGVVGAGDLPAAIARAAQVTAHESLESARLKFEERFVRAALARAAGHRGRAAAALGLSRQGLAKLMQRLNLDA